MEERDGGGVIAIHNDREVGGRAGGKEGEGGREGGREGEKEGEGGEGRRNGGKGGRGSHCNHKSGSGRERGRERGREGGMEVSEVGGSHCNHNDYDYILTADGSIVTELNISYAGNSEVVSSESSVQTAPVAASSSSKVKPAVTPRKKRAGPISRSQQDCSGQGKCCTGCHRADLDLMHECKCPLCPSEAFLVPFTFFFPLLLPLTLLSSSSNHFTTYYTLPPVQTRGRG